MTRHPRSILGPHYIPTVQRSKTSHSPQATTLSDLCSSPVPSPTGLPSSGSQCRFLETSSATPCCMNSSRHSWKSSSSKTDSALAPCTKSLRSMRLAGEDFLAALGACGEQASARAWTQMAHLVAPVSFGTHCQWGQI